MGIETFNAINEGIYFGVWLMIEVIVLMSTTVAIVGFVIYLVGTVWFYFEDTRQSRTALRTARRASPPKTWESAPRVPRAQVRLTFAEEPLLREQQLPQGDRQRSGKLLSGADRHSPVAAPASLGR